MDTLLLIYNNKTLGSGGFGQVYSSLLDEEMCACKVIAEKKKFIGINHPIEPIIMLHMRHECINFSRAMTCKEDTIYLTSIQAKCALNSMKGREFCKNKHYLRILHNLFRAVYFMHKHNLVHCDIKPANILYYENGQIRLTDFSITRNAAWRCQDVRVGTRGYMAPEIFRREKFAMASDIWSLGCTVFELIVGEKLFSGEEDLLDKPSELSGFIQTRLVNFPPKHSKFPEDVQKKLREILRGMLTVDADKRISVTELYYHPLFAHLGYSHYDHEEYHTVVARTARNKTFAAGCEILRNEIFSQHSKVIGLAQRIFRQIKISLPTKLEEEKLNIIAKTSICLAIKLYYGTFPNNASFRLEEYLLSDRENIEKFELEIIAKINLMPAIVNEI